MTKNSLTLEEATRRLVDYRKPWGDRLIVIKVKHALAASTGLIVLLLLMYLALKGQL